MDPTAAIPAHFTLETLSVAFAGLVVAWSVVRKRWAGAVGGAVLGVGEALHAGQYLSSEDEPALFVLRLVGVVLLGVVAATVGGRRKLVLAAGIALIAGGAVWGTIAGGGIDDFPLGAHLVLAFGSLWLGLWAWQMSRDSIRLRVLTALVGILAIAIVVGGGAVSRVAALDKQNEELRQLGSSTEALRRGLVDEGDDLGLRAALLSAAIADDVLVPGRPIQLGPDLATEQANAIAIFKPEGDVRSFAARSTRGAPSYSKEDVRSNTAVRSALGGKVDASFDVVSNGLAVIGAAPIYRGESTQTRADVIGAVAIVRIRTADALQGVAAAYQPRAEVAFVGPDGTALSDPMLEGIRPLEAADEMIATGRVVVAGGDVPAAAAVIGDDVRLVVAGSDAIVVDAATGVLRALLIAILASAALAVVASLWLSARVTRPILDLAEGAERVKADFLSSVSHELRTPLTPIRGYTELLRRGRVPARRAADYLDEIGEAAGRLERIVTLLLEVAAIEAGRFRIDPSDPHPGDLLGEAAGRWRHHARRHPIQVRAPRSLPRVRADAEAIARVLDELLDNAVKFSPAGGPIELRARRTSGGIEIAVADEGIGISAEKADELTSVFLQAESGDRRRFGGLGLGLTYVAGALAAHDSQLAVESREGEGTTFSFTLPTTSMVTRMPAEASRLSDRGRPRPSR